MTGVEIKTGYHFPGQSVTVTWFIQILGSVL